MSTYNKSLPKPSEIRWMNSKRLSRVETITMPFKGTIPSGSSYIGWRQSSYAYSYQVQYKVKARMVPDKQLETGSEYTTTGWKYPNPNWSGNVDTFNKCVTMDKEHRYYRYYNFAGKSLMTKGSYDKMQVTVRVRSFNSKKKQHGAWVTKTLNVKCKPDVTVHKIVALADGGIQIYLNTHGWKRGDSEVILNNIKYASKTKKMNKKKLVEEVGAIGGEEASGYPYAEFAGNLFNGDFEENAKITLSSCFFKTCDGVSVSLDGTYTISPIEAEISAPKIELDRDASIGRLYFKVSKSDSAEDWDTVDAWMLYTNDEGEKVRLDYAYAYGTDDATRYFNFTPPLDTELFFRVGIKNNLGGSYKKTYSVSDLANLKPIPSNGKVLINYSDGTETQMKNGMFNGKQAASMDYEVEKSFSAKRQHESEIPFGRSRPIAFLGEGIERTISVKGSIDASRDASMQTASKSNLKDWLEFQNHLGLVFIRFPEGEFYTALCTGLSLEQDDEFEEFYKVNLTLEEVDI